MISLKAAFMSIRFCAPGFAGHTEPDNNLALSETIEQAGETHL